MKTVQRTLLLVICALFGVSAILSLLGWADGQSSASAAAPLALASVGGIDFGAPQDLLLTAGIPATSF